MVGCLALQSNQSTSSGTVSVASTNLDLGTAVVGFAAQATDTLTNGSSDTVTIASVTSSNSSFQMMTPATPFMLAPGQTASLAIAFKPKSAGKPTGKISVSTNGGGTIDIAVSGNAVVAGTLAASPGSLTFGNVGVGQSAAKAVTLTNSGGTSVTVSQASVSSGAFSISGLTLPVTIDAGQSAAFNVVFAPKSAGAVSGNVTINGVSSLSAKSKKTSSKANDTAPASVAFTRFGRRNHSGTINGGALQRLVWQCDDRKHAESDSHLDQLGRYECERLASQRDRSRVERQRPDLAAVIGSGSERVISTGFFSDVGGDREWRPYHYIDRQQCKSEHCCDRNRSGAGCARAESRQR